MEPRVAKTQRAVLLLNDSRPPLGRRGRAAYSFQALPRISRAPPDTDH